MFVQIGRRTQTEMMMRGHSSAISLSNAIADILRLMKHGDSGEHMTSLGIRSQGMRSSCDTCKQSRDVARYFRVTCSTNVCDTAIPVKS
jgi:hypothetical protein